MSIHLLFFVVFLVELCGFSFAADTKVSTDSTPSTTAKLPSSPVQQHDLSSVTLLKCCLRRLENSQKQQPAHAHSQQHVQVNSVESDSNDYVTSDAESQWLSDKEDSTDELNDESMNSGDVDASPASINSFPPFPPRRRDVFRAVLSSYVDPVQSDHWLTMGSGERLLRDVVCEAVRPSRADWDPRLHALSQTRSMVGGAGLDCFYSGGRFPRRNEIAYLTNIQQVYNYIQRLAALQAVRLLNVREVELYNMLVVRFNQLQQANTHLQLTYSFY